MKTKLIRKSYKVEIRPNGQQKIKINKFIGCCRFVYNKGLDYSIKEYEKDNNHKFSYVNLANKLIEWKNEFVWLKECQSQTLQQSLKDLESAYKNFFKKNGKFPKFKSKGVKDSFRYPQGIKLDQDNKRIYLPKIGWTRFFNDIEVIGKIKNVTISKKVGRYFASIQVELLIPDTEHKNKGNKIGIDLGIKRLITLSNGEYINPINSFKKFSNKLASLQKRLKNKVKGSNNFNKLMNKIRKLHFKISNIRKDYLHKISHKLTEDYGTIVMEDLKTSNMSKSAKGDQENHGKNVKVKSGLNRSILDQGWFMLKTFIQYKLDWKGGELILVDPKFTSQTCPECGHVSKDNRVTQEKFECIECGYYNNADVVGAINILRKGLDNLVLV